MRSLILSAVAVKVKRKAPANNATSPPWKNPRQPGRQRPTSASSQPNAAAALTESISQTCR